MHLYLRLGIEIGEHEAKAYVRGGVEGDAALKVTVFHVTYTVWEWENEDEEIKKLRGEAWLRVRY